MLHFRLGVGEAPRTPRSSQLLCRFPAGVFFTVCMAFLVLSLSKSILLVKFLHDERCSGQEWPLLCLRREADTDGPRVDARAQLSGVTGL